MERPPSIAWSETDGPCDESCFWNQQPDGHTHHEITLSVQGQPADFTTPYSLGSAHSGVVTLKGLLASLLSDASGADQDFESWCSDLGFDPDSRKALKAYEACEDTRDWLLSVWPDLEKFSGDPEILASYWANLSEYGLGSEVCDSCHGLGWVPGEDGIECCDTDFGHFLDGDDDAALEVAMRDLAECWGTILTPMSRELAG